MVLDFLQQVYEKNEAKKRSLGLRIVISVYGHGSLCLRVPRKTLPVFSLKVDTFNFLSSSVAVEGVFG